MLLPWIAFGQKQMDTLVADAALGRIFLDHPVLDSIKLSVEPGGRFLEVYSKKMWKSPEYDNNFPSPERYNLNFEGDKYLLHKRWGAIPLPEKAIAALQSRTCGLYFNLRGMARNDTIVFRLVYNCPSDTTEKYFLKVETGTRYTGGKPALRLLLDNAVRQNPAVLKQMPGDSALFFKVMLSRKDSCLKAIQLTDGDYSGFARVIMEELKRSGPWLPPLQSGRPVNAYFIIFVRLKPDNTLFVDFNN